MEIDTSTVSGNSAEAVGGILNFGVASITDSVVANNSSFDFSLPAGIENFATLTITNTTIAGNSAAGEGGGILNWGNVGIYDSTIADNDAFVDGGGIANLGSGTFELQNTILARNTAHFVQAPDCFGPITSLGHNIVGDPTGCTITLLGTDKTGDPGLGSFQDDGTAGNGHVPLLETSQAIDAGDPSSCTATDQLGHARVDGDGNGSVTCDMGAVEFIPADTDGDGIPDSLDQCPHQNLRPTVVIAGCDSGVPNALLPTGCTVSDLVMLCAAGASNHGAFVSCVSHLTNDLKTAGIITGGQSGKIVSCAARASIP